MARLRIRLELNPGGVGVRLDKLSKLSGEIDKFIRNLAFDSGVDIKPGELVAKNFYNSSVGADLEYEENISTKVVEDIGQNIGHFADLKNGSVAEIPRFSQETLHNFIELGKHLDPDERFKLGVIEANHKDPKDDNWHDFDKSLTLVLDELLNEEYEWYGAVQGVVGSWICQKNYFNLRSWAGDSIKCRYKPEKYNEVYKVFKNKGAVIHVSGDIKSDKVSDKIKEIFIDHIDEYESLTDDEFERIISGVFSPSSASKTVQFVDKKRGVNDE